MVIASSLPSPGLIAAALIGALLIAGALSLLMLRLPDALPMLAVFALPFRLPISADGRTVNLLIPLYLVVVAGIIARWLAPSLSRRAALAAGTGTPGAPSLRAALAAGKGSPGKGSPGAPGERARPGAGLREAALRMRTAGFWRGPSGLEALLAIAVILYALQATYSADHAKAGENLAFFYIPFGLLFLLLRSVSWTRRLLLRCLGEVVGLAVIFAAIGFVEYYRKSLFLNPKVVAADQFDNYFRVNSLFFDPNIYGRFLMLVMIAVMAIVLWTRSRRDVLIGAGILIWLLAGLVTSFSQSSIAALLLGLAVLAANRWDVRSTIYISGALVAIAAVFVAVAPASLHFGLKGSNGSTSNATSGRGKLISGGLHLFADRPLEGYGSGSFEREYRRHQHTGSENATSASHTIPITVAAEQGILGLAVYVALILIAISVLFTGAGRSPPRIALAAGFLALVLHTWTYADFLEDPFTWTILAIGVALARAAGEAGEAAETGAGLPRPEPITPLS
jgi:O-antigen ligase